MAKKITRIIVTIIFFVIPFLLGLALGIGIGSKSKNKVTSDENTNNGKVELIDQDLTKELFDIINNNYLERLIYNYRTNGVEFNKLTNNEKLYLSGIDKYYKSNGTWVSFDTLKDNLVDIYSTDFGLKSDNYNYHDIASIKYNKGDYSSSEKVSEYTDSSIYIDLYEASKLEKDNTNYYLTVWGIYYQKLKNSVNYSNDKGFIFNEALSKSTTTSELYKTNKEQFMKYVFLFNKSNNKYILNKLIINN